MTLAEVDYPLLNLFWTTFIIFGWILWFWLLFVVFGDLFRRHDIGGGAKTGWVIFVLVLPFIGSFTYLITQGRSMAERTQREQETQRAATEAYIRSVAAESGGSGSPADEIARAKSLLDSGAISQEEFERLKAKALV